MTEPVFQPAQDPPQPPVPPRNPRNHVVLVLALALGVAIAVIATLTVVLITQSDSTSSTPPTTESKPGRFELNGTFKLQDGVSRLTAAGSCAGSGGYHDIASGTQVTVYSSAGEVLATGIIDTPLYIASTNSCNFHLKVTDVPDNYDYYQVEVSHRGKIAVSHSEAKSGTVNLTLGS